MRIVPACELILIGQGRLVPLSFAKVRTSGGQFKLAAAT
jgi:hypothetical protein